MIPADHPPPLRHHGSATLLHRGHTIIFPSSSSLPPQPLTLVATTSAATTLAATPRQPSYLHTSMTTPPARHHKGCVVFLVTEDVRLVSQLAPQRVRCVLGHRGGAFGFSTSTTKETDKDAFGSRKVLRECLDVHFRTKGAFGCA
nr:hypothetical protein [Tanacetum cinerariifolium]